MTTFLHIPLLLALLGIVMRGSAFVFRSQRGEGSRWSVVFSVSSLLTPIFLGIVVGALAGGRLPASVENGTFASLYVEPWLGAFPAVMGLYTLALFAFVAAAYLTVEARDAALAEDFRARALGSGVLLGALAGAALLLARRDAPVLYEGLVARPLFHIATGAAAVSALACLWRRCYAWARALAGGQAALIVLGWGLAQAPYLIYPHYRFDGAAAPPEVLRPVAWLLGAGALLVAPAFLYLFRVFKRAQGQ